MTTTLRRGGSLLGLLLCASLALGACGGDDEPTSNADPIAVLTEAKRLFDDAASVRFTMATDASPGGSDAILGADGVLTRQPAFQGSVSVNYSGIKVDVPVTAVDGKVWAKLPISPTTSEIDPADFGAPDPADFADPEQGISALLLELDGLEASGRSRDGAEVLSTYTGTLTGDRVQPIIPSASTEGDFEIVVGIGDEGRMSTLEVTGDFFSNSSEVTYELAFSAYGENVTVTAP